MIRALLPLLLLATPAAAQGFDPFGEAGIDARPGARVPIDAGFQDSTGRAVSLRGLAGGKPVLLVPVLHNCPNLCGVTLAGLADAVVAQPLRPGRDFALVIFGIDPKEGPDDAARDVAALRIRRSGRMLGPVASLVGDAAAVRAVTHSIGYRYAWDARIRQYAHVAAIAVITPEGRLSGWLHGLTPSPADLHAALVDARAEKQGSWGEKLALLCFHYDSATGRYTPAIEKILRLAGLLTIAAIALLVLRLRRKPA